MRYECLKYVRSIKAQGVKSINSTKNKWIQSRDEGGLHQFQSVLVGGTRSL